MTAWWQTAKTTSLAGVAPLVGLERRGRSWGPCVACGASKRSRRDRRPPVSIRRDGVLWYCWCCRAGGSVLDLVSYRLTGRSWSPGADGVRDWFDSRGVLPSLPSPPPRTLERPPRSELDALWGSSSRSAKNWPPPIRRFLEQRDDIDQHGLSMWDPEALERIGVVRCLPDPRCHRWPSWWPRHWASVWRLAVRCYEVDGRAATIHARAVRPVSTGRTRWPGGYDAARVFMAGPTGRAFLRGENVPMSAGIWVLEGLTDLVAASLVVHHQEIPAVLLGGAAGSFRALSSVRWPAEVLRGDVPVIARTDDDDTGDEYARQICRAVQPLGIRVLRAPWETNHG